jgi:hypothetical protein
VYAPPLQTLAVVVEFYSFLVENFNKRTCSPSTFIAFLSKATQGNKKKTGEK